MQGKIKFHDGSYSDQIDCMVALGEGSQIGRSDHYAYALNDIIAVVEVKKTLTPARLKDSLAGFKKIADRRLAEPFSDELAAASTRMARDAFRAAFNRASPRDEGAVLGNPYTAADNFAYATIRMAASLPLFLVWGYSGYKSEKGFRQALFDVMFEKGKGNWETLIGRPDYIIAGDLTYTKACGMPFVTSPVLPNSRVYAYTQNGLKVRTVLNLLWYRLCQRFKRDFMILSDGRIFAVNPIVSWTQAGGAPEVTCHLTSKQSLVTAELSPPLPRPISLEEFIVLSMIDCNSEIDITDMQKVVQLMTQLIPGALEFCSKMGLDNPKRIVWRSYPQLLKELTSSGFMEHEVNKLRLTTTRMQVQLTKEAILGFDNRDGAYNAVLPDGFLAYLRTLPDEHHKTNVFFVFGGDDGKPPAFFKFDPSGIA
jgi:hypothetical protein